MKKYVLTLILLAGALAGQAQKDPREQIEAAKIALITERLELTPEQAEKFWPIYNEYSRKAEELRTRFAQARQQHNPETASEEENKRLLELGMRVKEQSVDLERQYSERMLQVISSRQLMSLRKAENDFKEMILKRLREQQQRREQLRNRQQNPQDMQRRRN